MPWAAPTSGTGISVKLVETGAPGTIERIRAQVRDAVEDERREVPAGVPAPEFDSAGAGGHAAICALTLPRRKPEAERAAPGGIGMA